MPEFADRERLDAMVQREFFYLGACGPEGRRWLLELLDDESSRLRLDIATAMRMLREFDVEGGRGFLASIDRRLRARSPGFSSVTRYLRRWHRSGLAYLHYLHDDLAAAELELTGAEAEIIQILSRDRFLLPLAIQCGDLVIQRARMARRLGRWAKVEAQLALLAGILAGDRAYCVLSSGRPIALADLRAYFAALPLDEEARRRAAVFLGADGSVAARIEQITQEIFALPDVVIPYP